MNRILAATAIAALLGGCASSHILVGTQRPPISPDQVRIYLDPPAVFEKVAVLQSSNVGSFSFTQQQKTNKVIERLKGEAASLGANGILFQGVNDQYAGSVGSGNAWAYGNTAYGIGMSSAMFNKVGNGIAIYVPPQQETQAAALQPLQAPQPHATPMVPTSSSAPSPAAQTAAAPSQQTAPTSQEQREPDPAKRCDACQRLKVPQ